MTVIPPKRAGVDLSHITLNPDGSRSADIAALKQRPEVQHKLVAIKRHRDAARDTKPNP